uniref:Uncharacterized protein n=1 Tax=Nelumbo nucifera TaxID=4432 RepID=A0A822XPE1_NELNU|nr:TPA_asm: hypothetical protein HUJ06_022068 [Nelumbo nucifera]
MHRVRRNQGTMNRRLLKIPGEILTSSRLKDLLLIFSSLCILYLVVSHYRISTLLQIRHTQPYPSSSSSPPTSLSHLAFAIASSSKSWPNRRHYVRLWWKPQLMRGYVFLDRKPPDSATTNTTESLPPVLISEDTSRFPYTYKGGLRSAIRVSRIVSEIVARNLSDVRWFVFGDDDTVFFPENLAKTLSKYDHNRWYYVGSSSESFEQNSRFSFEMAFGGGGFAISYPLARVLARVMDSCLMRYSHLYGSDSRIFSCLAELGVGLTHESGFHQVDIRGNLFGLLSAHPLAPIISLHHLDSVDPIFPNRSQIQALEHLFNVVNVDPARILQQTVCYDQSNSQTVSVSWGYAVQVFEGIQLLPDLILMQRTFMPWRRSLNVNLSHFMFNMRVFPKDPCKRPSIFFLGNVLTNTNVTQSNYSKDTIRSCLKKSASQNLEQIKVFSPKLELDYGQVLPQKFLVCFIQVL